MPLIEGAGREAPEGPSPPVRRQKLATTEIAEPMTLFEPLFC